VDNLRAQSEGSRQYFAGALHVARLHRFTHHGRTPTNRVTKEWRRVDAKTKARREITKKIDRSFAIMTKVKILADDDVLRGEVGHEHSFDERRRGLLREHVVKVKNADLLNPKFLESLETLFEGLNLKWRACGSEHGGGVRVKRNDTGYAVMSPS
jgi:hypothetical protein